MTTDQLKITQGFTDSTAGIVVIFSAEGTKHVGLITDEYKEQGDRLYRRVDTRKEGVWVEVLASSQKDA